MDSDTPDNKPVVKTKRRSKKKPTSYCFNCCVRCENFIKTSFTYILLVLATFTWVWPTIVAALYYYTKEKAKRVDAYKIIFIGHVVRIVIMGLLQVPEKLAQM